MTDVNSLHLSCAPAAAMDSPMEIEDNMELEEITMVRGAHDHILERGEERQTRRDRDIRGQYNRGDRRRRHRDGERDREDYRSNKGPRHHPRRR